MRIKTSDCYIFIITITLLYFSYRYVFKWANDLSSGTYSKTPIIISSGKYIVCIALIILAVLLAIQGRKVIININGILVLLILCFADSLYSLFFVMDQNTLMIFLGITTMLAMFITPSRNIVNVKLDRLFRFFMYFNIIYEFVQVVLYFSRGRLPAIAWENSGIMAVRFGGAFDDPFALSLFLGFMIPYISYRYVGIKKVLLLSVHFVMLILTWTLTSILALLVVYIIYNLYVFLGGKKDFTKRMILAIFIIFLGTILLIFYGEVFISDLIATKAGSIKGHLDSLSLEGLSVWNVLGVIPESHYSEVTVVKMLFTNGLPFIICFFFISIYSIDRTRRTIEYGLKNGFKNEYEKPILVGMICYQMAFVIGSFNLPFPYMFFNMIMFSVFVGTNITHNKMIDLRIVKGSVN